MKISSLTIVLALGAFVFATVSCLDVENPNDQLRDAGGFVPGVLQAAKEVVEALTLQDGKKLAALVHPKKGVRFSPSAYVDVATDVVFSKIQIETFWNDQKSYTWGFANGTGDPIHLTPNQYYHEYILDRDFTNPSSINVNNDRAAGNTNNNAADVYPKGTVVEYYIEPSNHDGGSELDWAALRLIFERSGDIWFLVALIHDGWTT